MKYTIHKDEKLILQCGFNKESDNNLYIVALPNKKLCITDTWLTDYPINYGLNGSGEFLGTGFDGTFFYSKIWEQHQETILNTVKDYHKKQAGFTYV